MTHGLARGLTNYGDPDFALYLRRSFAMSMGYSSAALARPIVGIADSGSGFNNCHRHLPELIDAVKRGVLAASALPVEFPTISLGEVFLEPPGMLYRRVVRLGLTFGACLHDQWGSVRRAGERRQLCHVSFGLAWPSLA